MLHALLNNKLSVLEDRQTSSVFGLLQYLPAQTMWNLLQQSCGENSKLPQNSGELQSIEFWPSWSAKGEDISNSVRVEPDVFCEFENFNLIIEAKIGDQIGQYEGQWINQINAYTNEYPESEKKLVYIAFGGNEMLKTKEIIIREQQKHTVFSASWLNLLNEVVKYKKICLSNTKKRLLSDIILAFEKHGHFSIEWLEALYKKPISEEQDSIKIIDLWKSCSIVFFQNFYENNKLNLNSNSKNIIALWRTH